MMTKYYIHNKKVHLISNYFHISFCLNVFAEKFVKYINVRIRFAKHFLILISL